jgi:hypothetical protein
MQNDLRDCCSRNDGNAGGTETVQSNAQCSANLAGDGDQEFQALANWNMNEEKDLLLLLQEQVCSNDKC